MRNYLFVCSRNKLRSPTAEHVFADMQGIQSLSAGTNRDAEEPVTDELLDWADSIFVMERIHRTKLQKNHRRALKDKPVVVLDILDEYQYMDEELVQLLKARMRRWITME